MWGKAEALERVDGDEELLRELCQIFLQESPKLLVNLRRAIVDTDAQAVMCAAHSLKGELGYLGAAGASQAAQELEDMGQKNNLFRAADTLDRAGAGNGESASGADRLPRERFSEPSRLPAANSSPRPDLPPPDTVLIAEDDPIFRRVLENWLRNGTIGSPRWRTDSMPGARCNRRMLRRWRFWIG